MRVDDLAKLYIVFPAVAFCGALAVPLLDGSASRISDAGRLGVVSLLLMSIGAWVFIRRDRRLGATLTLVAALTFSWWMVSIVSASFVSLLVLSAGLLGAFAMVVVAFGGSIGVLRPD